MADPDVLYGTKEVGLRIWKKHAMKVAKQLCYSQEVIDNIEAADSVISIDHIMYDARNDNYERLDRIFGKGNDPGHEEDSGRYHY